MPRMLIAIVVLAAVVGGLAMGARSSGQQSRRVRAAENRIDSLEKALQVARNNAYAAQYASKESERLERVAAIKLQRQLASARSLNDFAKAVSMDTSASADRLRDGLIVATAQVDSLSDLITEYAATVDTLRERHALERRAMAVVLSDADSVIAVQKALIATLKADRCRILGLPCPSRTQALIAGVVLGVVLR